MLIYFANQLPSECIRKQAITRMTLPLASRTAWIFDLDGTLTVPVHNFAYIRQELSIPDGEDILGHLETLPSIIAQQRHKRLDEIELELAVQAIPSPGVPELLEYLFSSGADLGILTRNTRGVALLTLESLGIRHYFHDDNVLGREEAKPKPDPSGIYHLQGKWSAESQQTVMVGDYLFDLLAGKAAGAMTIHVG